jgi:YHS domain-containing protein
MRQAVLLLGLAIALIGAGASDDSKPELRKAFLPFEHMIGSWKGTGVPAANRLKGWAETHRWAWMFRKGDPAGLSIELTGDKTLAKARLTFDESTKRYHLDGSDPSGKPVAFAGAMDKAGKALVLDRVGASADGKDRLVLRPNSNMIRYVLYFEHQDKGAPQYKRTVEVNLGKEGESFAAGAASSNLPKCILTGGAATMTVSYQGKSYPVCCSGCRDEFQENPEKYVKKAAAMAESSGKDAGKSNGSSVGKDDGSFDGLLDEEKPKESPKAGAPSETPSKGTGHAATKKRGGASGKGSAKAEAELRLAKELERRGKSAEALKAYRRIVSSYSDAPEAKTAGARIKALSDD